MQIIVIYFFSFFCTFYTSSQLFCEMGLYSNTLPQSGGVNVAKSLVTPLSSVHVSSGPSISSWSLSLIHKFSQAQSRGFPDRRSLEMNKHSYMRKYRKKKKVCVGGCLLSVLCVTYGNEMLKFWNVLHDSMERLLSLRFLWRVGDGISENPNEAAKCMI